MNQNTTDPAADRDPLAGVQPPGGKPPRSKFSREKKRLLARNIFSNWTWYMLVLVSGFLMPRLISGYRGRVSLGLWDLGWSLLVYIDMLMLGVGSAVNRFVARHRTVGDWTGMNVTINSCLAILTVSFTIALVLTAVFVATVPTLLPEVRTEAVAIAELAVALLTLSASLRLPFGVFNGIITGYERFDLLNIIRGVGDTLALIGMVTMLLTGHSIAALAGTILLAEVLVSISKYLTARHLFPEMRLSPRLMSWRTIKDMVGFGGKTFVQGLARSGLYQFNNILVAYFLGPAVLAVYARQRSLVMQAVRFIKQYSQVFVPTSSSLHAHDDLVGLRQLTMQSSRYGFYVSLPITALLVLMGGPLLQVWMGAGYRAPVILAILAVGHMLSMPQQGVYSVLVGMGRHGLPSLMELVGAIVGISICAFTLGVLGWNMIGAAFAVAVPVTLVDGLFVPAYGCRLLGVSLLRYVRSVLAGPALAVIPFALCLVTCRIVWRGEPVRALGFGLLAGGCVLAGVYWTWVLPVSIRTKITEKLAGRKATKPV